MDLESYKVFKQFLRSLKKKEAPSEHVSALFNIWVYF